jgi:two-component system sensor histidine kinase UhpB
MLLKNVSLWLLLLSAANAVAQPDLPPADKALSIFLSTANIEEKSNMAFALGEHYWSMRKLPQAKKWYSTSLALTPAANNTNNVVNILHLLANVYLNEAIYDSALFYINKSFSSIDQISNKVFLPNLYQTKGRIYLSLGDQHSAVKFFTIADSLYLSSADTTMQAQSPYIKIVLGQLFEDQNQLIRAKEYYDVAFKLSQSLKSVFAEASSLQTIANWHCKMKEFKKARDMYFQLLQPPLYNAGSYRMIYIYTGLGDVYFGLNRPDSSLYYYRLGLQESIAKGEQYQQDEFYGKMGNVYAMLKNKALAKVYYDSALQLGRRNKNWSSSINAYHQLAEIAFDEKDYKAAYGHLQLKQQLSDSVLNFKNLEMSNNLYILNNIKQKDVAISTLTALDVDNRKLIEQGKTITYLLFGLVGLMVLSFLVITNRSKLKRKLEKQFVITQERERIITDLHDDVGATLSSMHIYSELAANMVDGKQQKAKELLGKISQQGKDLSGRMSDIIWSLKPAGEEKYSLAGRLRNFSQELLAGKGIKVDFHIDSDIDSRIENPLVRKNILLVTKEAMNNIAKYSGAAIVIIMLKQSDGCIELTIQDDGRGFDTNTATSGNGLSNIRQRSLHVKGTCRIDSSPGKGTLIRCTFPIAIISHTA